MPIRACLQSSKCLIFIIRMGNNFIEISQRQQIAKSLKIYKCLLTPNCIRNQSCCYLLIIYMKKVPQKVKTDEILEACIICNLHLCYNFALLLCEKCTHFQPIECPYFYVYHDYRWIKQPPPPTVSCLNNLKGLHSMHAFKQMIQWYLYAFLVPAIPCHQWLKTSGKSKSIFF